MRDVNHVLNGAEAESESDQRLRDRLAYNLDILLHYSRALGGIRGQIDMSIPAFTNGMS